MGEFIMANKIEYRIYDEPIEVENVYEQFPDGGVILYYKSSDNKIFVSVYIRYKYGIADTLYYYSRFMATGPEALAYRSMDVFFIIPTKEKVLFWKKPLKVSRDYFYGDSFLSRYFMNSMSVFGSNELWACILFNENEEIGIMTIFGIENTEISLAEEDKEKLKPYVYVRKTIDEYNTERRVFISNHPGASGGVLDSVSEDGLRGRIRKWLDETSYADFCDAITGRVRGQKNTKKILVNIYNFLECVAGRKKHNNNILLAAPSGCGKTETFRAIKDYFKEHIPGLIIYQYDMTSLTEEGYKGNNKMDMIKPLSEADKDEQIGIAFLDEFDKKLMPSFSGGGQNVNAAVQAQILTLIEGSDQKFNGRIDIDTSDTMFIGMGAFDTCRKKRIENSSSIGFGFGSAKTADHYDEITREDMIALGASYELIGRFTSIINYYALGYGAVDEILDDICRSEGSQLGFEIRLSDALRADLHENANSKFGCRLLRSIIHDRAMDEYMHVLESGNAKKCPVITLYAEDEETEDFGPV